jgi:hypothetical protein
VLLKWLQCRTGRYTSLWCLYNRSGLMISVQALVVARRPEYKKAKRAYQQQTQSHNQAQTSSSHTQPADASTPPAPGANTTTVSTAPAQLPPIPWWAQIVLFSAVHLRHAQMVISTVDSAFVYLSLCLSVHHYPSCNALNTTMLIVVGKGRTVCFLLSFVSFPLLLHIKAWIY